ncbi:unnamed protein product, partial [Pylaiella littoralis]
LILNVETKALRPDSKSGPLGKTSLRRRGEGGRLRRGGAWERVESCPAQAARRCNKQRQEERRRITEEVGLSRDPGNGEGLGSSEGQVMGDACLPPRLGSFRPHRDYDHDPLLSQG